MAIRYLLFCWFSLGFIGQMAGQKDISEKLNVKKHYIFWNMTNFIDPNGASMQLGYNYQVKPWMDLQMEVGFVSDDLIPTRLPFKEYAGFRVRPQIKFFRKDSYDQPRRLYGGILLSYQRLIFKENSNFEIESSFNQNINYSGLDQIFAGYLVGGLEFKSSNRLITSVSVGIGQVTIKTETTEGNIPENAVILSDCVLFCGRSEFLNFGITRPGFLLDFKIGYRF